MYFVFQTQKQIAEIIGRASVTTGPIGMWGDKEGGCTNWIYYFGYAAVPIRLLFERECCVGAELLSQKKQDFFHLEITQFCGGSLGKTVAEMIRIHGEPKEIKEDLLGRTAYVWGLGRDKHATIPFVNGRVVERTDCYMTMGWNHRGDF